MTKDGKITTFGDDVVEIVWKECNLEKEEEREQIIQLLREWVRQQDHFIKKEYSQIYFERSLFTSKGSVEKTKKQIDKMCTYRTLLPQYFQIVNVKESEIMELLKYGHVGVLPRLSDEYYRIIVVKVNPDTKGLMSNFTTLFFQLLTLTAEYIKNTDFHRGVALVIDLHDCSTIDILFKINLLQLREYLPILTEGYGAKIKAIIFITSSKIIESFINIVKPFFSEKIGSRFQVANSKEQVKDFVGPVDILPQEYGGKEPPFLEIASNLVEYLSSETHQKLLIEMHAAKTDESKRRTDVFNDEYMGMAGTFRTLKVD